MVISRRPGLPMTSSNRGKTDEEPSFRGCSGRRGIERGSCACASDRLRPSAIERVLAEYRSAIERLDARGTERLFAADSAVFENDGVEGTNHLAHHLGPELGHFRSLCFADHRLDLWCDGAVAAATETYTYSYRIERTEDAPIERRGVTTSVLRRTGRNWQIANMHGSSRAPRPAT